MEHIVIIGNGISGITCARYIRKNSDKKITVVAGEIEFFFSRTALRWRKKIWIKKHFILLKEKIFCALAV